MVILVYEFSVLFSQIFKDKVRNTTWKYSSNRLKGDEFVYYEDDYTMDELELTGNIRNIYIDNNNLRSKSVIVLNCVQTITINYPTGDNYIHFSLMFPIESAESARYVSLVNYRGVINGILPNLVNLALKDCNLTNIDWIGSLEELRISGTTFEGIDDLKKAVQNKAPVKRQVWENRPTSIITIKDIGRGDELYDATNTANFYFCREPRRICGSYWAYVKYSLEHDKEKDIDHVYIDGRDFAEADLDAIIPIIKGLNIRSIKIATTDYKRYGSILKTLILTYPHEITELTFHGKEWGEIVEQFYYNSNTNYMATHNFKIFALYGKHVKYLTLWSKNLQEMNDEILITAFRERCAQLKFLKITAPSADANGVIVPFVLTEGSHISNEYIEVLRDDSHKHTEVIFKAYDKKFKNMEIVYEKDASYRFVFEASFQFKQAFLQIFFLLISKLKSIKYIEFVGTLEPLCKLIKSQYGNETFLKELFLESEALVGIHVQDYKSNTSFKDFIDFTCNCKGLQYFVASFSSPIILKADTGATPLVFGTSNKSNWVHLKFAGNPLTNTFVFAKQTEIATTQEIELKEQRQLNELRELFERPSLTKAFDDLFKQKKPVSTDAL